MLCVNRSRCEKFGAQVGFLQDIEDMRGKYKPHEAHVLFIAESPPTQSGDIIKFFYNPLWSRRSGLRESLRQYLIEGGFKEFGGTGDRRFCERFRDNGFYLIDAIRCPVDSRAEKRRLANECKGNLFHEINQIKPRIIFTLGKTASTFFIPKVKISDCHGRHLRPSELAVDLPAGTAWVILSVFPSPRNRRLVQDLSKPFDKLKMLM